MIHFLLLSLFSITNVNSEVITVTAEKIARPFDETTSSVIVITESEIKKSQKSSLNKLIQEKSGIFLNSNGAGGKTSSLFLRGADSSFTLVVIDGVEYSDKSSTGGAPLYEYLSLNNVKQIEILKGSQSVLYGSDALAGVIKITTKSAGVKDGQFSLGLGSHDDKQVSINSQGKAEFFDYSLGLFMKELGGISSYNQKRQEMAEDDGYSNLTGQIKLEKSIADHNFQFNLLGIKANSEYDSASADLTMNVARDDQYLASLIYRNIFSDYLMPQIKFSQNRSDRLNTYYNSFTTNTDISRLIAKTNKFEIENISLLSGLTLLQGLEYEETKASITTLENKKNHKSIATYLNAQKNWHGLEIQLGGRVTKERDYENQFVWKLGGRYNLLKSTSLKANASTGFKSPSLYQLYSASGDANLLPTESKSYDLGLTQKIMEHDLELVYFYNTYKNFIDFDSTTSQYGNTFKTETSGVEFNINGGFKGFTYGSNATFLKAINLSKGNVGGYLPRRPRRKYSLYIDKTLAFGDLGADARYVGRRENSDFDTIILSSYFTMDLRGSYNLSENSKILLLLGNVLDKDYEQISGYGSLGRTWQLKWRAKL